MNAYSDASQETVRLSDLCAECLILILQLREMPDFGPGDRLRMRFKELLMQMEQRARAAYLPAEDVEEATFALIAFIDEVVARSTWSEREAWMASPLQLERFGRFDAGDEFFGRLERLRGIRGRMQALEVYYLCLVLGFRGRYLVHNTEQVRYLIDALYQELGQGARARSHVLAPHGLPREGFAREEKKRPLWPFLVGIVAIGVLVYVILWFLQLGAADSTLQVLQAAG